MPNVFKNNSVRIIETKQFLLLRVKQCISLYIYHKNNTFTSYLDSGKKQFLSFTYKIVVINIYGKVA